MRLLLPLLLLLPLAGCAIPQSEICRAYITCQQDYDAAAGTGPVPVDQYEEDGLCWNAAETADECDRQCEEGIAANAEAAANAGLDVPSCAPG